MTTVSRVHEASDDVRDMVRRVLLYHVGQANAISREDLAHEVASRLNLNGDMPDWFDRTVRQAIADLRDDDKMGALICSSSGASGYWIAADDDELEASLAEDDRRGKTILARSSHRRKTGLEQLRALPLVQERLLP
jgi:hypothetical protein